MTREELNTALRLGQVNLVASSRRYDAHKTMYDAACFAGDAATAAAERVHMHDALDAMLDHTASCMTVTRKLMELPT